MPPLDTACVLRPERPADAQAIAALTEAAFLHAPHASHTEALIVDALRAAGQLAVSLVAELHGTPVGHVAASPVALSSGATGWYGLAPVSVLPAHQRQGIGTQMVREALARLRARGAAGCVVLGDPAYYGRFGFRAEPGLVLPDVPPAYFQALCWQGACPVARVAFHAAFDAGSGRAQ